MNKLDIYNLHLADFGHNFNKTRQTLSDVILQEGSGVAVIPTLAKKITSELAEVSSVGWFCPETPGGSDRPKAVLFSALTLCPYFDAWIFEFQAYLRPATFYQSVV